MPQQQASRRLAIATFVISSIALFMTALDNLAHAYWRSGRLDLALPLCVELLAKRQATLGPDHPNTLISMNNLAQAYQEDGKASLALPLLQQTLAKRQVKLGLDHPDTLLSMNNLAEAHRSAGKLDLALPEHQGLAPVFSAGTVPTYQQARDEWEADLKGDIDGIFVAEIDGAVVGTAVGVPLEKSGSHLGPYASC